MNTLTPPNATALAFILDPASKYLRLMNLSKLATIQPDMVIHSSSHAVISSQSALEYGVKNETSWSTYRISDGLSGAAVTHDIRVQSTKCRSTNGLRVNLSEVQRAAERTLLFR